MSKTKNLLALDVGSARIGVAMADMAVKIAVPYGVIDVGGDEIKDIAHLVVRHDIDIVVVGYPRNQSGEATQQTSSVEAFAKQLEDIAPVLEFQDESLTSVIAEERLQSQGREYTKADIDAEAATIILQDYLETST